MAGLKIRGIGEKCCKVTFNKLQTIVDMYATKAVAKRETEKFTRYSYFSRLAC